MTLKKEVKVDKIELVNGVNLQVREVVNIIENGEVIDYSYSTTAIKLYKNYIYDSVELLEDVNYQQLLKAVCKVSSP